MLTEQESKFLTYIKSKQANKIAYEEFAQFAKDPQAVKMKTIQRVISEIKKKLSESNSPDVDTIKHISFYSLGADSSKPKTIKTSIIIDSPVAGQSLVKIERPKQTVKDEFALDIPNRRVKTKSGSYSLNEREWEVFKYLHENAGRIIKQSEIKDKVLFHNWGSKTPARWFTVIQGVIGNIRKQVTGINTRLLTVRVGGEESGYLFQ